MNKQLKKAEMEIIRFDTEDVIATSGYSEEAESESDAVDAGDNNVIE